MRKIVFFALCAVFCTSLSAQNVREQLKENLFKASSNYYAYPTPNKQLTPAPKGKKPFYLSHYARHGSRYMIKAKDYDYPYNVLRKAKDQGKLSPVGLQALERVEALREEAKNRYGELTPLGVEQHHQIAQRMYDRFPQVFSDKAVVDAKSTVVIRCTISMQSELLQLVKNNPRLIIKSDASQHDMYYMNLQDSALYKKRYPKESMDNYKIFCKPYTIDKKAMGRLFNDSVYVRDSVDTYNLNLALFKMASSVQGTEMRFHFNLFDIYTLDELFNNWLQANAYWYISFGNNPLNGGQQPFTQRNLLRKIIEEADSCIALPRPGATLRFGHETIVLPLTCLLGINGFDQQFTNLEDLDTHGWINFEVFPMAANIQFVFYRKNPKDQDVLVKVLLNEDEATLPLETDCAPYYHWSDFRDYYLKKLDSFKE